MNKRLMMAVCGLGLAVGLTGWMTGCGGSDGGDDGGGGGSACADTCNKVTVACMGDSITGDVNNGVPPYPSVLVGMMPQNTIVNQGRGGEESSGGARRVNNVLSRYNPCSLCILYGANDLMHFVAKGTTMDNLRYMVRAAKGRGTVPLVATLTPMLYSTHWIFQGGADALNVMIREMASQEGAILVDLAAEFKGSETELMSADGVHPNAAGVQVMAVAFFEALQ